MSRNPVLVYGGDVARAGAWDQGLALAEKLQAPVWTACFPERISFPQDHPLAAGPLPPAIGPLSQAWIRFLIPASVRRAPCA